MSSVKTREMRMQSRGEAGQPSLKSSLEMAVEGSRTSSTEARSTNRSPKSDSVREREIEQQYEMTHTSDTDLSGLQDGSQVPDVCLVCDTELGR